jgi:iron complex transport system ATP-binding protein
MDQVILSASRATYRYAGAPQDAVREVDLEVRPGQLLALLGPNGSGKTTLVRLLLGVLKPAGGNVSVLARPAHAWTRPEMARMVGVVVQREEPAFPITVKQTVALGRYPRHGPWEPLGETDARAVERALARCDVADLAGRWVSTLSGGEWQRVRLARALAQEPRALVLDEPTANLDLRHEMEVFELVADLVRREGLAALVITHHVNLAARYAHRLVMLHQGSVRAAGTPAAVLTRETLEDVYAWPVELLAWRQVPQFVPLRRTETDPNSADRRTGGARQGPE